MRVCAMCIVHCITVVMSMLGGVVGSWELVVGSWEGPVEMLKDNMAGAWNCIK